MNLLFPIFILLSLISSIFSGKLPFMSSALLEGACGAVNLLIALTGTMALWSGIMEVAKEANLVFWLSSLFKPLLNSIFGKKNLNTEQREMISFNLSANLLGLGNAATPSGLKAMELLHRAGKEKEETLFVVLNSCSLQLIPTTVAAVRLSAGSKAPFDIALPILLCSLVSAVTAVLIAKGLTAKRRNDK